MFCFSADSSADPLLDEHFRRSLGADYQSLFKKNSPPSPPTQHSVTSSLSAQQQQQQHTTGFVTSSVKSRSPSLSPDSSSSSMKLADPVVKAFKDDMDMEGYTGKHTYGHFKYSKASQIYHLSYLGDQKG